MSSAKELSHRRFGAGNNLNKKSLSYQMSDASTFIEIYQQEKMGRIDEKLQSINMD